MVFYPVERIEILEAPECIVLPQRMREMQETQEILAAVPLEEVEEYVQWAYRIILPTQEMEERGITVFKSFSQQEELALDHPVSAPMDGKPIVDTGYLGECL